MRLTATRTSITSGGGAVLDAIQQEDPTLDLQFSENKTLTNDVDGDDLITFSRASSATYVGSDGLIKTTPVNLLTYSEEFDDASWAKSNSTITANTVSAPNGEITADALIENTAASTHSTTKSVSVSSGTTYTFTVYAKANGRSHVDLNVSGVVTTTCIVRFTLSGSGTSALRQGSPAPTHSIAALSNGWYRCQLAFTTTSTGSGSFQAALAPDATSSPFYTGDGTSGIYLWGAQLEEGTTATDYIPTQGTISGAPRFDHDPATGESLGLLIEESRTNLLTYSEEFDQSVSWLVTQGASIIPNATSSPDGSQTADKQVGASETNWFTCSQFPTVVVGNVYTGSIYAKAGGFRYLRVLDSQGTNIYFDLETGNTSGMESAGNGWYRCSWTVTTTATPYNYRLYVTDNNTGVQPTGDGVKGVYIWGAQLEKGSFPTSYIPTEASAVTRAADVAEITGNKFAKTNLLQYSERFEQSAWLTQGIVTVTPNAVTAPDGKSAADRVQFSAGDQNIRQVITVTSGLEYTASVYIKGTAGETIRIDAAGVTQVPNVTLTGGWDRFSLTGNASGTTASLNINTFTSATARDIYLWGAQLEEGSELTEYTPSVESFTSRASSATYVDDTTGLITTTPVNLVTYSEEFTSWTLFNVTVASGGSAPDGSFNAGEVLETSNSSSHHLYSNNTDVSTGTVSAYVKANGRDHMGLRLYSGSADWESITFNLTGAGSVTDQQSGGSTQYSGVQASIQAQSNGWYRLIVTATRTATGGLKSSLFESRSSGTPVLDGTGANNYVGDPAKGFYIWGAQVEEGSTATTYIPTTSTISGAARYENGELLLEEARTNLLTYSEEFEQSAWTKARTTITANAAAAPDGTTTADKLVRGTDNNTNVIYQTVSLAAATYTFSVSAKQGEYNFCTLVLPGAQGWSANYWISVDLTDGSYATSTPTPAAVSVVAQSNGWYRISITQAATATVTRGGYIDARSSSGFSAQAGDGTSGIYIWGAQLEEGSYPTSYIPTTGTTVTRAADVSTSALGVDSWYNQSEGTVFMEARCGGLGANGAVTIAGQFSDGTTSNFWDTFRYQLLGRAVLTSGGVNQVLLDPSAPINTFHKTAFGVKLNDFALSTDGATPLLDNAGVMPVGVNQLQIGDDATGTSRSLNGHIKRLSYFPTRLPDATLQNITT